jgi:hypothetical protein
MSFSPRGAVSSKYNAATNRSAERPVGRPQSKDDELEELRSMRRVTQRNIAVESPAILALISAEDDDADEENDAHKEENDAQEYVRGQVSSIDMAMTVNMRSIDLALLEAPIVPSFRFIFIIAFSFSTLFSTT